MTCAYYLLTLKFPAASVVPPVRGAPPLPALHVVGHIKQGLSISAHLTHFIYIFEGGLPNTF